MVPPPHARRELQGTPFTPPALVPAAVAVTLAYSGVAYRSADKRWQAALASPQLCLARNAFLSSAGFKPPNGTAECIFTL